MTKSGQNVKRQSAPRLSLVIPVFNEKQNVARLHQESFSVLRKLKKEFEIIFVDDGSTDRTFEELKKLKPIKIIQFRRNFGQAAALDAGIKEAKGKILITMDGDGQNDPKDIPKLLKKLNQYDCVCGWRYKRKDPFGKKFISKGAAFLGKFLVDPKIHDSGCTLRVYKKECFEKLDLYGEMHRMIPAILRWQGFKITEIKVNHRPRKSGKTKYNWKRAVKGFLDMGSLWFWRKYSTRSLHLFGSIGLLLVFFGGLLLFGLAIARLFYHYSLSDKIWPLVGFFSVLIGVQFFVFGILTDILIKNYYKDKEDEPYFIKNIIEK